MNTIDVSTLGPDARYQVKALAAKLASDSEEWEEGQRKISMLSLAIENHEKLTEPSSAGDFNMAFDALNSTITVLTLSELPEGTEHHQAHMLAALCPHLSRLKYEHESTVQRLQKISLELELMKQQEANQWSRNQWLP